MKRSSQELNQLNQQQQERPSSMSEQQQEQEQQEQQQLLSSQPPQQTPASEEKETKKPKQEEDKEEGEGEGEGPHVHPESKRTSEWRKAFWSLTNKEAGGAPVPAALTKEEMGSSWQQLEEYKEDCGVDEAVVDDAAQLCTPEYAQQLEAEAAQNWDKFYSHFGEKFFKDRNYLRREFPSLFELSATAAADGSTSPVVAMEIGCGAGNTAIPLLKETAAEPRPVYVHAFDFSPNAVEVMKARPEFDPARCHPFVCDISEPGALAPHVRNASVDVAMAIFVLSAIAPEKMSNAMAQVFDALAPGGHFFVRDYGVSDMTQLRFVAKAGRKIQDNFYVRADGTRVYFFSKAEMERLALDAGFKIESLVYDTRILRNRKREINMKRIWITAHFVKPLPDESSEKH